MKAKCPLCFVLICLIGFMSSARAINPGDYPENASFLGFNYLHYSSWASSETSEFASKAHTYYAVKFWFPNAGLINASGLLANPPTQSLLFLNTLKAYEDANGYTYTVMPWINGNKSVVDLSNPNVRANIVLECTRCVSGVVPGSYVEGTSRPFSGVIINIEPAGLDNEFFGNLKQLMIEIRGAFNDAGLYGAKTGVALHKLGTANASNSSVSDYHYIARYVNYVVAMTYNSGSSSGAQYRSWMQQQTKDILKAVSGVTWNNDGLHPPPTNDVKVFLGCPAYPAGTYHDPGAENVVNMSLGAFDGLNDLDDGGDMLSLGYFQGAAMYLHNGGENQVPASTFARYSTEWWWWGRYWLGAW